MHSTKQDQLDKQLMQASECGQTKKIAGLISAGADVNAKEEDGWTALHNAAWDGHAEACKILLSLGADANALDFEGDSALLFAARHSDAICKHLISAGADVNVSSNARVTPLHVAAMRGRTST